MDGTPEKKHRREVFSRLLDSFTEIGKLVKETCPAGLEREAALEALEESFAVCTWSLSAALGAPASPPGNPS